MRWPRHFEASGLVAAPPGVLFAHLDDPHKLAGHMERPSAAMLGMKMAIACDARGGQAVGSVIRMSGRIAGIDLQLEEVVTERVPPLRKAWRTRGRPQLLVVSGYRLGFRIAAAPGGAHLTVSIDYGLPPSGFAHLLGVLLGGAYARWCCRQMVRDAQRAFSARPSPRTVR